jgi:alpha-N-acetylglucosamine transferase
MLAYATLATNPDYSLGALALARSLRSVGAAHPLLVLATVGATHLDELERENCRIIPAELPTFSQSFIERHRTASLHQEAPFTKGGKPSFHDPLLNFCKLHVWRLADFQKIVFIDADAVAVKPCDRLFEYPAFSAAPNVYETIADFARMNSGVFVAAPDPSIYDAMLEELDAEDRFWRRTDQTFLQHFFPDWHGLPYIWNTLQYVYFNLPDLWHWPSIRIVHYQYEKPWDRAHRKADRLQPLIDLWWRLFDGRPPPDHLPTPFGLGA